MVIGKEPTAKTPWCPLPAWERYLGLSVPPHYQYIPHLCSFSALGVSSSCAPVLSLWPPEVTAPCLHALDML